MHKFIFLMLIFFASMKASAFFGEFTDERAIPPHSQISRVDVRLFDMAREGYASECLSANNPNDKACFRIDIFINNQHVARWVASPGKPHYGTDFEGGYTPSYPNGTPFSTWRNYGPGYVSSRGDPMPYAAFWERNDGGYPVIATHCGRTNGNRLSHGCVRLNCSGYDTNGNRRRDAKRVRDWVKAAQNNGGVAIMYTEHTRP